MPPLKTGPRKDDHIRTNLEEDVSFGETTTGLERYRFVHQGLPELDLDAVDTSTTFLGHHLTFPLMIASMTGGTARAGEFNRCLAEAAQAAGIGMGLGSTRIMLERPEVAWSFKVRKYAPDIPLFANIGAVQLNYGYGPDTCRRLVEETEADGLFFHLNPLQEALQPEGDTRFDNVMPKIAEVCKSLAAASIPVIVKEVGWGLSPRVARMLIDAGVSALDVAGAGGTSWSQVEMYRSQTYVQREVAASFRDWGIPTATNILQIRAIDKEIPLIGSGGIRTGIDIAKCIALGADISTLAGVILRATAGGTQALRDRIEILHRQFQITMFVTGTPDVAALRDAPLTYDGGAFDR